MHEHILHIRQYKFTWNPLVDPVAQTANIQPKYFAQSTANNVPSPVATYFNGKTE